MSAAQYMADVFRRHGVVEPDRLSEALGQVCLLYTSDAADE